jgi:shikimate dehydrogenase
MSIKILNMAGANITVPYKNDVIKFIDGIDRTAEKIGSVNTIINRNGRLIGYNNDGD